MFGDVHHPQPVGTVGVELPADKIISRLRTVTAGAAMPAPARDPGHAGLAHQPFDAFA
jgi:hypothetical protein